MWIFVLNSLSGYASSVGGTSFPPWSDQTYNRECSESLVYQSVKSRVEYFLLGVLGLIPEAKEIMPVQSSIQKCCPLLAPFIVNTFFFSKPKKLYYQVKKECNLAFSF